MESLLPPGNQAVKGVEVIQNGGEGDSTVDQLVLEFLVMELTEPPAARLARLAGDGAQRQFISNTFDRNPVLERLAASVVPQLLGDSMQRNLSNQHHGDFNSSLSMDRVQQLRLLYLIREVLQSRNTLCESVHAQTKQDSSIQPQMHHTLLQQDLNANNASRPCEKCGSNRQFTYQGNLTQNTPLEQNMINQQESDGGQVKAASKVVTTPKAGQERQVLRTSKLIEKVDKSDVIMTVKVYVPKPPPGVKCSYIGRLIGPNGITIRELQTQTKCHIAVRGRGSIKDSKLYRKMRHKPGFRHLRENTHVLVEAKATSRDECRSMIEKAKKRISEMFTPEFDALKREQLIHLAVLNGTYRSGLISARRR